MKNKTKSKKHTHKPMHTGGGNVVCSECGESCSFVPVKIKPMKNKNRKSFFATIKINTKKRTPKIKAVIFRIKQNIPGYIGDINFRETFKSEQERDEAIIKFLQYNGHVLHCHSLGNEFLLTVV